MIWIIRTLTFLHRSTYASMISLLSLSHARARLFSWVASKTGSRWLSSRDFLTSVSADFVHSFIRMPDSVGVTYLIHMYIPDCICVFVSLYRCGYNLRAASSTTANLHRHQKWKMLASPNLSFLHLLYAVRVNVTSPT